MNIRPGAKISLACLVSATALAAPALAAAQDAPQKAPELDAVIVTAQKRGENVQQVPIAITAVAGDQLQARQVVNALDVANQVPALQINHVFAGSNPTIFLRGVGVNDYNPASAGAVGVTVDEVFLNAGVGQLFQVYDVDRMEVLRGPQGTLYGRNTTGGVINFFTRKPSFTPELAADLTYGRFNQLFADIAAGGPLVGDTLAGRVSLSVKSRDGWTTNLVNGDKQNDIDSVAGRAQLLFKPTDRLSIEAKLEGGRSDASAYRSKQAGTYNLAAGRPCTGQEVLALDICANPLTGYVDTASPRQARTDVLDNHEKLRNLATVTRTTWEGEAVTLTAISAFVRNKRLMSQDQDSSPFSIVYSPIWTEKSEQVSQELRLASRGGERFNWVAGGYYLRDRLDSLTDFELLAQFSPTPTASYFDPAQSIMAIERRFTQVTRSLALFAQGDLKLTDRLKLTAGVRYTDDRKALDFISYAGPVNARTNPNARLAQPLVGLIDADGANATIDAPVHAVDRLRKPTWNLSLDYQLRPSVLAYASYSRGVRAGGHNTGAIVSPLEFTAVRSERLDAYQAGLKTDLLDRRLRVNAAAFYYDDHDMQVFGIGPGNPIPVQRLQNADARIYGGELEIQAAPAAGLELNAGAAWLNAAYTHFADPIRGDFSGQRLDKAPRLQLNGSARYRWSFSPRWSAMAAADLSHQSKVYFSPANTAPAIGRAHGQVDLRASLADRRSGVELGVFVENATNASYLQDIADQSSFGFYQMYYNEPRTFGLTARYRM